MSKIKIAELFGNTVQGEGRYVGVPSVFIRTFGCNFRCPGFNRPKDQQGANQEVIQVIKNLDQYKTYEELPLVHTGCDSYPAVYPEFKNLSPFVEIDDLAQRIVDLLPAKVWRDEHLIITGGEPLLGWQKAYPDLLDHPLMASLKELTFETNGTQKLQPVLADYLTSWASTRALHCVTFSVSPKLSCSGESLSESIQPEIVCEYEQYGYTYLKFVIATEEDADEALGVVEQYRNHGFTGPVYFMPIGGTVESYQLNNQAVANLAIKHGVRYSPRLHVDLYGNQWGT